MSSEVRSVLIINPYGIGDVIYSTPLIRNVAEKYPQAKITFLANKRTKTVLKNHPNVHQIIVYERDEFVPPRVTQFQSYLKYINFIKNLRRQKFDCVFDLSLSSKFGFFSLLAGIRKRYGLDYKKRGRFLTQKITFPGVLDAHIVRYYTKIFSLIGGDVKFHPMELYEDEGSKQWVRNFFDEHKINLDQDTIIGVAPAGGKAFGEQAFMKLWPKQSFVKLLNMLLDQNPSIKLFLYCSQSEEYDVKEILDGVSQKERCFLFSRQTINEVISLVKTNKLFIGNDTGPLRIANAFGIKFLAFFGPVDEKTYGGYPEDDKRYRILFKDVPCRPCYHFFKLPKCERNRECLSGVAPEYAKQQVLDLLDLKEVAG